MRKRNDLKSQNSSPTSKLSYADVLRSADRFLTGLHPARTTIVNLSCQTNLEQYLVPKPLSNLNLNLHPDLNLDFNLSLNLHLDLTLYLTLHLDLNL